MKNIFNTVHTTDPTDKPQKRNNNDCNYYVNHSHL